MTKPFGMDELLARLRSAVRRATPAEEEAVVTTPDLAIDLAATRAVNAVGAEVRHADRMAYEKETDYLRVLMAQVRRKLEPGSSAPKYFITEPGMGYRFESP